MKPGFSPRPASGVSGIAMRKLLSSRCRTVLRELRRAREDFEVEAVHDLRVATRRLQEALQFFEPRLPRRPARRLVRRARRIRRSLGDLRNADVTLELLEGIVGELDDPKDRTLTRLRKDLEDEARALRGALIRRRRTAVPGIRKRVWALLSGCRRGEASLPPSRVAAILNGRLRGILAFLPAASRGDAEALHRLRLAVKGYRYTLEILASLGVAGAKQELREARKLQEELGRLHDLDVLLELQKTVSTSTGPLVRRLRERRLRELAHVRAALDHFEKGRGRTMDAIRARRVR